MSVVGLFDKKSDEKIGNKALRLRKLKIFRNSSSYRSFWKIPDGKILIYDVSDPIIDFLKKSIRNGLDERYGDIVKGFEKQYEYIMSPTLLSNQECILEGIYSEISNYLYERDEVKDVCKKLREVINEFDVDTLYLRSSTNVGDRPDATYAGIFKSIPLIKVIEEKDLIEQLVEFYAPLVSPKAIRMYWRYNQNLDFRMALFIHEITGSGNLDYRLSCEMAIWNQKEMELNCVYGFNIGKDEKVPICNNEEESIVIYPTNLVYHIDSPTSYNHHYIQKGQQEYWANLNWAKKYGLCATRGRNISLEEEIEHYRRKLENGHLIPIIDEILREIENSGDPLFKELRETRILIEFTFPKDDLIQILQIRGEKVEHQRG